MFLSFWVWKRKSLNGVVWLQKNHTHKPHYCRVPQAMFFYILDFHAAKVMNSSKIIIRTKILQIVFSLLVFRRTGRRVPMYTTLVHVCLILRGIQSWWCCCFMCSFRTKTNFVMKSLPRLGNLCHRKSK